MIRILINSTILTLLMFFSVPSFGAEKSKEMQNKSLEKIDVPKISAAFGHLIGKNLESLGFQFDIDELVKGLKDSVEGKDSPMTEAECIQAITQIQEKAFNQLAQENLKIAEDFLANNSKGNNIHKIEDGKIQYKINHEGKGAEVQNHFTPVIRYTGKFVDGKVFGSSKEDEKISLDETIPGFAKGIVGMKEGEKRTLFIHPELGYGTSGYLPPNSLLTFEVELVKANEPTSEQAAGEGSEKELANCQSNESEAVR